MKHADLLEFIYPESLNRTSLTEFMAQVETQKYKSN